jgi:glyoxylase-like metal-dependent hydrolase (beta-lactamase superfamily II)
VLALADGDAVTGPGWTLEALFTPGHMSNHMCFALREEQARLAAALAAESAACARAACRRATCSRSR